MAGVPFDQIHLVWDEARELLLSSMEMSGGRLDEKSVLRALLKREMQLWIAEEGAAVTQIVTYPTGIKVVSIVLVGGRMDKWLHCRLEIEAWARSNGCEVAEIPRGRKGWEKVLKDWTPMVFMEKRL